MQTPRFLIIRLRAIGDVLISTCLAETIKANFPKAQVDYVVYENCASMLQENPFIDNIIIIPGGKNKSILQALKALVFLRKQKYDYVIDVINTPKSLVLSKLLGTKMIIGAKENNYRNRFYNIRVAFTNEFLADSAASNTVKHNLQLLSSLPEIKHYCEHYRMAFADAELLQAKASLQGVGVDISQPFIFLGINNSMPEIKSWPLVNFAKVIDTCHQIYGIQTVSYPGPGELAFDQQLRALLKTPAQHFTIVNQSLRELAVIIKLSCLFIGNDSSPMHIALACDTPSIAIFAPQVNYLDWHFQGDKKHRVMSIQSASGYTDMEYLRFLANFSWKRHSEYYSKITISAVLQALAELLS